MASTESITLKNCTREMETTIQINLKDIANFLYIRNILPRATYYSVTNVRSMLTPEEKACEVLGVLINKVEKDKDVYRIFMEYVLTEPQYRAIAEILMKEYARLDPEAAPAKLTSDRSDEAGQPRIYNLEPHQPPGMCSGGFKRTRPDDLQCGDYLQPPLGASYSHQHGFPAPASPYGYEHHQPPPGASYSHQHGFPAPAGPYGYEHLQPPPGASYSHQHGFPAPAGPYGYEHLQPPPGASYSHQHGFPAPASPYGYEHQQPGPSLPFQGQQQPPYIGAQRYPSHQGYPHQPLLWSNPQTPNTYPHHPLAQPSQGQHQSGPQHYPPHQVYHHQTIWGQIPNTSLQYGLEQPSQAFIATSASSSNSSAISCYAEDLKSIYASNLIRNDKKWPPTPSKKFISLTLTHHHHRHEESVDKIMKGDVETLLQCREEVTMENVFELIDGNFGLVLVEGAPGIGKSALSWELCRNWGTYDTMSKFTLVVLLRLMEEEVRNIENEAGLFKGQEDVAKEIGKVQGKGVLFILDGYDKLPVRLQHKGFLFDKLISGVAFPQSTVLVTSRHSATVTLLRSCCPLLKSHIEVLGFTQERVEEYAESVFQDSKMLSEFRAYISASKNPAINSLMYVPLYSVIVVDLFKDRSAGSGLMPSTMTELYIELCLTILKRYLDLQGQEVILNDFKSLTEDRYQEFLALCKIAYGGIADQKVIFHKLDPSLEHFGFLDRVASLRGGGAISYNFLHLTVQEFLAAYHISQLTNDEDKQNIAEQQKHGSHWNIVQRFVAGLTKSVPEFDPLHLTPELIQCLYEAQCTADYARLFGGECRVVGCINEPLLAYALGYCISNSEASWEKITTLGARALDSFVSGFNSRKAPHGGHIRKMIIQLDEDEQLAANHFMSAPLSGVPCLICTPVPWVVDKLSDAISVMHGLEKLDLVLDSESDNRSVIHLVDKLKSSNVKALSLPNLRTKESLQEYCSALHQLIDPSSSGKLVELELQMNCDLDACIKVLSIIFAPSTLQTTTFFYRGHDPTILELPATCTNTNVTKLTCVVPWACLTPAHVLGLMERNTALQELIIYHHEYSKPSFLHFCYGIMKGIPDSTSLERVIIHETSSDQTLMRRCREEIDDLRKCANTQSADTFINLVTERGLIEMLDDPGHIVEDYD